MQPTGDFKCLATNLPDGGMLQLPGAVSMAKAAVETRFQIQRDRLLKAAASCFNRKGYSGTSLKDVADHLGLTDAALYYYVRNKEELVYQCYLRAAELGGEALARARDEGENGLQQAFLYVRYHVEIMVGEQGPVAIMSEIPSLKPAHRNEILAVSRRHSLAFENILAAGIQDGSIRDCDVRMTGNAIMGSINWIPKWFHGDAGAARKVLREFPQILTSGLPLPGNT
ncbi:MAG: TetR/AcrR family transcriptional regulator [Gammaproteobacteria bacterium]|nr:MAG: TetR/AcrR family transcriptional regulator [Gammaproteobacteria bacterium]